MHTSVSGVADHLATSDAHAIRLAREAVQDLGDASPKISVRLVTDDLNCTLPCRRIVSRTKAEIPQCPDLPYTRLRIWMPSFPPILDKRTTCAKSLLELLMVANSESLSRNTAKPS